MKCPSCGERTPDSLPQCAHCDAPTGAGASGYSGFSNPIESSSSESSSSDSLTQSGSSTNQNFGFGSTSSGGPMIEVSGKTMIVLLCLATLPFIAFFVLVPMYHESQGRVAHYQVTWCIDTRSGMGASASEIRSQGYQATQRMVPGYSRLGREGLMSTRVQCFRKDAGQQEPSISSMNTRYEYRQVSTSYREPKPEPQSAF